MFDWTMLYITKLNIISPWLSNFIKTGPTEKFSKIREAPV